ncbi:hypothetical protein HPP92_001581 [Vanilla planifolia]|uniref:Major facilitator superfamily (MFS) profile domain-containing protein n=1 Tax=Vanilla planifolia TaxID=51239 RepID=A0A835S4U4_VANPL|nr:hypothetical protein HPP92_001581 [Vanilla planifolia]
MAGGAIVNGGVGGKEYPGSMTMFVFLTCLVAATGGLIFGYDIGISGGVTSMDSFLKKFFPNVYRKEKEDTSTNQYCKFDSQLLTTFTSSLYLAALIASFFAATVTRVFGRKWSMFGGGVTFLIGAALNGAARNVAMLIVGRILLGIGVGFANQSVPVYLSEMAPAKLRGMLNIGFQLMITIGILAANLINYGTAKIKGGWGWRVSLALAAVPAGIITVGSSSSLTPNSLIERGHDEEARNMLRKVRGTDNIHEEYADLKAASDESKTVKHPWRNIAQTRYRPQLTMAILIPFFQQLTGINVIMFYAPVLFKTIGFGSDASLMSAVITGLVNVFATLVSVFTVDRLGRRKLFLQGGAQMLACQIAVGTLIAIKFGTSGEATCPAPTPARWWLSSASTWRASPGHGGRWVGWSHQRSSVGDPIGWTEHQRVCEHALHLRHRAGVPFPALQSKVQPFLFLRWVGVFMTIFVAFFLPETKGVPIEEMVLVWKSHWFWSPSTCL